MAIFKLGAFATAIVGSIGGTNFRRGGNNAIVTNKSFGASKTKLYQNPWLNQISEIFKAWALLPLGKRNQYSDEALLYTFPDKFGVLRNLTGRQFYTKLAIQLLPVGASIPEPHLLNDNIVIATIDNFDIAEDLSIAELQISSPIEYTWFLVQLEVKQKNLLAPIFSRRKISYFVYSEGAAGFDVMPELLKQFPYINSNYRVRAFLTTMNESGFRSVATYKDASWYS
jgi:hypothetical protein